jgi:hypothetical protein
LAGEHHAEVEIRKLTVQVVQLQQQDAPHIFGDDPLIPLPNGT